MAADPEPIRVEPLSPAVGLWVSGIDLMRLDAGLAAMIEDLWQLGGALLFRSQAEPVRAAEALAAVLAAGVPFTPGSFGAVASVTGEWRMPGAVLPKPPQALVFVCAAALPALGMAGMEAAADALRMEDPDFLETLAGARARHAPDGPEQPLLFEHPESRATCFYPPPPELAAFSGAARLADFLGRPSFQYVHQWQPGDVLAVDPRAVRCRQAEAGHWPPNAVTVVPGSAPLQETRVPAGGWG